LRIWALLGARAGDNDQVIALAEALGLPFEIKQLQYNGLHAFGPRLLGRSLASLTKTARERLLGEPPPDLTISAGHRSVPVVRALRHRSHGRTRSIHVGFPRVSLAHFDLVIATPQYPIHDHADLLRVPYTLTRAQTVAADADDLAQIAALPAPRQLLIVGGPTLYWNLDQPALRRSLDAMLNDVKRDGGSVIVTTSPRTQPYVRDEIDGILDGSEVRSLLAEPRHRPGYASLLAGADSIRVTADSVAMISDAVWTGKPVAIVPIAKSALGRVAFGLIDAICPGKRLYPQDLRFFWRALAEAGVTEQLATPQVSAAAEMQIVVDRARSIINPLIER
jgi:mitochondrial fission protein ELM1